MDHDIEKILKYLRIDKRAKLLSDLLNTMLTVTTGNAEQIIEQINEMAQGRFLEQNWSENEPYYYLFKACAYEIVNQHFSAIDNARNAIALLQVRNLDWNESIAHWLLGILYRNSSYLDEAEDELKLALGILKELADSAKREFNYDTIKIYYQKIEEIQEALDQLSDDKSQQPVVDELAATYGILTWIIGLMEILDTDAHHKWRAEVCSLKPSDMLHVHQQIDFSVEVLKHDREVKPLTIPLAGLFLAHCYTLEYLAGDQNSLSLAITYAENAVAGFHSLETQYNEFLSHWYLAILYQSVADNEKSAFFQQNSDMLLQWFLENATDSNEYEQIVAIHSELQNQIKNLKYQGKSEGDKLRYESKKQPIQNTKTDRKSWLPWGERGRSSESKSLDSTPFRKNESATVQPSLQSNTQQKNPLQHGKSPKQVETTPPETNEKKLQHITIPVDIEALKQLNTNSKPLEADLFKSLQLYLEKKEANSVSSNPETIQATTSVRSVVVPSFPIYGQVAGGTRGEPNLESQGLELANEVYDDLCIILSGREYNIKFIDNKEYRFIQRKRYGWLKVIGHSMNNYSPAIKDGDYVLFVENRDIHSCVMKIVVAVLPDIVSQPSQLVVKQLLKLSTQLPSRRDGFDSEYFKFVLHSESTYEKDPKTDASYADIDIVRDNQVTGEVIAIAS